MTFSRRHAARRYDSRDFTNMLISWFDEGINGYSSDPGVVTFTRLFYELAGKLPADRLARTLQQRVPHFVMKVLAPTVAIKPFSAFILQGLEEMIDWEEVALYLIEEADRG